MSEAFIEFSTEGYMKIRVHLFDDRCDRLELKRGDDLVEIKIFDSLNVISQLQKMFGGY